MTFKAIEPDALPKTERKNRAAFDQDTLSQATETLLSGQAVVPDKTFKDDGAARRFALRLKHAIEATNPKLPKDKKVSTRTWPEGEQFRCAVLLRDAK